MSLKQQLLCPPCNRPFVYLKSFNKHVNICKPSSSNNIIINGDSISSTSISKQYKCAICSKKNSSLKWYNNHMAKLHDEESNLNIFNFCDSLFDISMP